MMQRTNINKTIIIRYDHHDSFGSHTSPNLGATYFIDDNSRFKANYGLSLIHI